MTRPSFLWVTEAAELEQALHDHPSGFIYELQLRADELEIEHAKVVAAPHPRAGGLGADAGAVHS